MTVDEIRANTLTDVNMPKVKATTEDDIQRHAVDDGEEPSANNAPSHVVIPPALVRAKTGLTQEQFARALRVPVKTLRNWEQGRTCPDPAANAPFVLVNADPVRMLALLWRVVIIFSVIGLSSKYRFVVALGGDPNQRKASTSSARSRVPTERRCGPIRNDFGRGVAPRRTTSHRHRERPLLHTA